VPFTAIRKPQLHAMQAVLQDLRNALRDMQRMMSCLHRFLHGLRRPLPAVR
jgi:hypothetical protein